MTSLYLLPPTMMSVKPQENNDVGLGGSNHGDESPACGTSSCKQSTAIRSLRAALMKQMINVVGRVSSKTLSETSKEAPLVQRESTITTTDVTCFIKEEALSTIDTTSCPTMVQSRKESEEESDREAAEENEIPSTPTTPSSSRRRRRRDRHGSGRSPKMIPSRHLSRGSNGHPRISIGSNSERETHKIPRRHLSDDSMTEIRSRNREGEATSAKFHRLPRRSCSLSTNPDTIIHQQWNNRGRTSKRSTSVTPGSRPSSKKPTAAATTTRARTRSRSIGINERLTAAGRKNAPGLQRQRSRSLEGQKPTKLVERQPRRRSLEVAMSDECTHCRSVGISDRQLAAGRNPPGLQRQRSRSLEGRKTPELVVQRQPRRRSLEVNMSDDHPTAQKPTDFQTTSQKEFWECTSCKCTQNKERYIFCKECGTAKQTQISPPKKEFWECTACNCSQNEERFRFCVGCGMAKQC